MFLYYTVYVPENISSEHLHFDIYIFYLISILCLSSACFAIYTFYLISTSILISYLASPVYISPLYTYYLKNIAILTYIT